MRIRPVRWLAAVVAAAAAAPAFAGGYIFTPYGPYAIPAGVYGPYNMAVGAGTNAYSAGYGVGGIFAAYGPYNQVPIGAYAAYPTAFGYNGLAGAYSGGYLPQVSAGIAAYAANAFAPYGTFGYNVPSRYNAYPSTLTYVPALYYGQYYASYIPISGYGPYYPPLNAYTAAGIYRPDGYVAYDPGPSVSVSNYVAPAYTSSEPTTPPNQAALTVEVPADAKVWFGGVETKQTGTRRAFLSPALDGMNQFYKYEIKAAWTQDGKPVEQTQTVYVKPGERSTVLFLKGAK